MIASIRHRFMSLAVAAVAGLSAAVLPLVVSTPAHAQAKPAAKKTVRKPAPAKKSSTRKKSSRSSAAQRADAMRRYKDYQYVKSMSPYAGSAYKWGSPW